MKDQVNSYSSVQKKKEQRRWPGSQVLMLACQWDGGRGPCLHSNVTTAAAAPFQPFSYSEIHSATGRAKMWTPNHPFTPDPNQIPKGFPLSFVNCKVHLCLPLVFFIQWKERSEMFYWFLHIDLTKGEINLEQVRTEHRFGEFTVFPRK